MEHVTPAGLPVAATAAAPDTGDEIGDTVDDDKDDADEDDGEVDTGEEDETGGEHFFLHVSSESMEKFNLTLDTTGTVALVSLASIATITCDFVCMCVLTSAASARRCI